MFWGDKGEYGEQSAVIKEAEKACPGLHVTALWDQGNYDNDLATKLGSGNAPDVFQLDGSKRLPEFVSQGALLDLTPYIAKDKLNLQQLFWGACLPETMYQGHTYGLERDCGNQGMLIFNKDMFDARGVAYPTATWTYKDLLAAAEKLSGNYSLPTDPTKKLRFGIGVQTDDYRINQYMWDWGGDWLSADLKTCTMTNAAAQAGLQWWHDLAWVHHGAPTPQQQSVVGDPVGGFQSQRYAMAFVGSWALDYLVKPSSYTGNKPVPFKWGVAPNPGGPVSHASLVSAGIEVASVHTKNPVAAYWLIKYLTMGSGTQIEAQYGIGIPGFKQISTTPAFLNEYQPYASVWLQGNTTAAGRAMRLVPQYDKFIDTVSTALKPFWNNSQSIQQTTSTACANVKSLLP
jgi:multiple sugar transport system substrate-binding protein